MFVIASPFCGYFGRPAFQDIHGIFHPFLWAQRLKWLSQASFSHCRRSRRLIRAMISCPTRRVSPAPRKNLYASGSPDGPLRSGLSECGLN